MDQARFMGTWYEITRDWTFTPEANSDCGVEIYHDKTDYIGVEFRMVFWYWWFQAFVVEQNLKCGSDGKCQISPFVSGDTNLDEGELNFMIVDTDYDNYAVVYSCINVFWGLWHYDAHWGMTREKTPSADYINTNIKKVMDDAVPDYNFDFHAYYAKHGDDNCSYD